MKMMNIMVSTLMSLTLLSDASQKLPVNGQHVTYVSMLQLIATCCTSTVTAPDDF
jgi:hypothetical protein